MEPKVNFITLAVTDMEQSLAFYRDGLGLQTKGVIGNEFTDNATGASGTIIFFEMLGGSLLLGLYGRADLAKDAGIDLSPPSSVEFSLGHAVNSKEEVDALLARVQTIGATMLEPAHTRPWGVYSGYFKDPDGHLWEIAWNPPVQTLR
jgi:catechol 2,3-dioxygenase-like lactoylglutathione lyase family enzyme